MSQEDGVDHRGKSKKSSKSLDKVSSNSEHDVGCQTKKPVNWVDN